MMKHRPLLFIIIGFFHLVEPLVKILYFKVTTSFSIQSIISNIASISSPLQIFEFWFLFPLGGIALLGIKKWSYPAFISVQVYSIYGHLSYEKFTWPYVSETPFYSSLFLLLINTLIIVYFSLPDVRKPFFDSSVRWWESRIRYNMTTPIIISINNPDIIHDCKVLNISQSGAFIDYQGIIELGQIININLSVQEFNIGLKAKIMSGHAFNGQKGFGIKFQFTNIWEELYLRKIIRSIAKKSKMAKEKDQSEQKAVA